MSRKAINDAVAYVRGLANKHGRNADWAELAVREAASITSDEALEIGVIDLIAKDVGSGKELSRTELGSVTSPPVLSVSEELIEVQIAGTPWMTLDRSTGEPVE